MFYEFKDILLEIGFIEEVKVIEVTKDAPLFPQYPLFAKIRFDPFDFVYP